MEQKNLQNLDRQLQTNNLRKIPKLGISCPHLSTAVAWREKKVQAFCLLQIFFSGIRTT